MYNILALFSISSRPSPFLIFFPSFVYNPKCQPASRTQQNSRSLSTLKPLEDPPATKPPDAILILSLSMLYLSYVVSTSLSISAICYLNTNTYIPGRILLYHTHTPIQLMVPNSFVSSLCIPIHQILS